MEFQLCALLLLRTVTEAVAQRGSSHATRLVRLPNYVTPQRGPAPLSVKILALFVSVLSWTRGSGLRAARNSAAFLALIYKMKVAIVVAVALAALGPIAEGNSAEGDESGTLLFADVISAIEQRQVELSQHPFFKMLADESIPVRRRMTFAPYWAYFALTAADLLDTWLYIPNPQSELEQRINTFVEEDNFHYNYFLHDMEHVFGYTLDRFGSYSAVMRHMYGAESKAVREIIYAWTVVASKYDDPLITLTTFEVIEAGLKDFFEVVYTKVYLAEEELRGMQYFGATHVELEMNHTMTSWFKGENPLRPLAELKITHLQQEHALEAMNAMFDKYVPHEKLHINKANCSLHAFFSCRLHPMYDALHNLALAEDSIWPEKYQLESTPPMHAFPLEHPNKIEYLKEKEEL